jgi:hypothetical protein
MHLSHNIPDIRLAEWGIVEPEKGHGWSVMITGTMYHDDRFLGGGQILSINLKEGTSDDVARQIMSMLSRHCDTISLTE